MYSRPHHVRRQTPPRPALCVQGESGRRRRARGQSVLRRGVRDGEYATCTVQKNAWFDERITLDWIDEVWQFEVTGTRVLVLDSLKVHMSALVRQVLADMGTFTVYIPGGATSVTQPLDVAVMGPLKLYVDMYTGVSPPLSAFERRRDMLVRAMTAVKDISADVAPHSTGCARIGYGLN